MADLKNTESFLHQRQLKYEGSKWIGYEWVVKGHDHIRITYNLNKFFSKWIAIDTKEYAIIEGKKIYKRLAKAKTRNDLVALLTV